MEAIERKNVDTNRDLAMDLHPEFFVSVPML